MKKNLVLIIVFVYLTFYGYSQTGITSQEIQNLSKKKFEWMISKNIDSLRTVLDDSLKYIHSNGWIQTKEDILDDLLNGKISYEQINITETATRVFESTVIMIGKGKFSGLVNKAPFSLELLFTEVYIIKENHWLLASRHSSKVQ